MRKYFWILTIFFLILVPPSFSAQMIQIHPGSYIPFYRPITKKVAPSGPAREIHVAGFFMDAASVTRADFLSFLKKHLDWTRSRVRPLFADSHYLSDWPSDLDPGIKNQLAPVTWVSWFAAKAYCEARGLDLPGTDQWEYAAFDQGRSRDQVTQEILNWYATPSSSRSLPGVRQGKANGFGVFDLFGLIWEWTLDFNSAVVGSEDKDLFCGNGSQGAADPGNYADFMRESFRRSLKASYTTGSLGFRCVRQGGGQNGL